MTTYNETMATTVRVPFTAEPAKAERQEAMGGLAKGLAIMESFTPRRPHLTISEAAVASDTTPAAARRCLLTLESLGYVSYDGKYFRPTPRFTRLAVSYTDTAPLTTLGQPKIIAVRDELDESVSLAVLEGAEAAFIARAEASRIVSAGVRLGSRLPAYASATGRMLLAALTDDELDARLRQATPVATTERTLLTVDEIRKRVQKAREEHYAYTDEELEYGVRTMAVPVTDSTGETRAAMSVSAFAARTSLDEMRSRFLPVLRREAESLGRML